MTDYYIGLMSGTSLDAIDAVLVDCSEPIRIIDAMDIELPNELREEIRALNSPTNNDLQRSLILDKQLGYLFSKAVQQLLAKTGVNTSEIIAIGSHGQTLRHAPDGKHGFSHQIGSGNIIAEQTGITTVCDFRGRDIAAGGQGAPLVPAFHQAALQSHEKNRAIINIGGMANLTLLAANGEILGFDTGPGNVLMDYWCKKNQQQKFDADGLWARTGTINTDLLNAMLAEPFFALPPPKSTGRELFDQHWLEQFDVNNNAADVQRTLLELTARSISDAIPSDTDEIYLCGGGAYNIYLKQRIAELSGLPTATTSDLGIPPEWMEATAFAWLAMRTIKQLAGNCPDATGSAGLRVLGAIYTA